MSSGRSSSLIVRSDAIMALIVLYGTREIGFRPGIFGLAVSAGGAAVTVFAWTIRQSITPSDLLGKMNGAFRFCVTGVMPFGALFGGWLGSIIGIRSTLVVGAIGLLLSCLGASFSHLMRLKSLPER